MPSAARLDCRAPCRRRIAGGSSRAVHTPRLLGRNAPGFCLPVPLFRVCSRRLTFGLGGLTVGGFQPLIRGALGDCIFDEVGISHLVPKGTKSTSEAPRTTSQLPP